MGTLDEWHAERFIYSVTYVNCEAALLFGDRKGLFLECEVMFCIIINEAT